jgi:predicted site-specific integrase-resolvase
MEKAKAKKRKLDNCKYAKISRQRKKNELDELIKYKNTTTEKIKQITEIINSIDTSKIDETKNKIDEIKKIISSNNVPDMEFLQDMEEDEFFRQICEDLDASAEAEDKLADGRKSKRRQSFKRKSKRKI